MRLKKLLIVPIIVAFASCGSGNDDPSDIGASIETFEMLEAVFDGPYSKYAIKDKLDEAFAIYNMEANQGNYLKAGNSLVDYRKDGKRIRKSLKTKDINEAFENAERYWKRYEVVEL